MKAQSKYKQKKFEKIRELEKFHNENFISIPFKFFEALNNDMELLLMSEMWEIFLKEGNPFIFDKDEFEKKYGATDIIHEMTRLRSSKMLLSLTQVKYRDRSKYRVHININKIEELFKGESYGNK